MMDAGPKAAQTRFDFVFVLEQPELFVSFDRQILQGFIRNTELTRHVHWELLCVEVFNPTAFRNAHLRAPEHLNVRGRIGLKGSNQHVIDIVRRDAERCESVQWTLAFRSRKLSTITESPSPAFVERRQIGRRTRIDNSRLSVSTN